MIKRIFLILFSILIFCSISFGRAKYQGIAEKGGKSVKTNTTTTYLLAETFPNCTITVYVAGTLTVANLYSNNSGTVKANPFTADSTASFFFYADNGRYDIKFSGTGIAAPFTKSDILLVDPVIPTTENAPLDPYQFGAFGTGVTHLITSQDIAAHPEWLGSYNTTYEWDTVAIQEMFYTAYGTGTPVRWATTTYYLNRECNFRNGRFRINHGLILNAVVGFKITGIRRATTLLWTGATASEAMIKADGLAYGEMGSFSLEASATNTAALLDIDFTGTFSTTLKQQQLSFHDIDYIGNSAANAGFRLNFISTSSGQGDTITIDNCSEFGFTDGYGAYLSGANVLQVTVKNGDSQGNKYGYYLNGAQVQFLNKHFENGGPTQVDKKGFDVFQSPQPLDGSLTVIDGTRSESMQLAYGVGKIINSRVAVGNEVGSWIANNPFQQGNVIVAGGKAWINIALNPTLSSYSDITSPFSTTVLTVSTPIVAGAFVGLPLSIKYPNCFTIITSPVISNTTTTITLPAISFIPGDATGQPCSPHTTYAVYSGAYPTTGGSQPDWTAAGNTAYNSGIDPSDMGASTTLSSPNVTTQAFFNNSYIGFPIILSKAGADGGNLYTTIASVTDSSHIVLSTNASATIPADGIFTFGTALRVKSITGSGGVITDGTVIWFEYEFYNLAMLGTFGKIADNTFNAGRIWGITPNITINDSFFSRNDWLHPRLILAGNNLTERRNIPSGLAPLTPLSLGSTNGGIMSGSRTFTELGTMTDILNGTIFYCSNCDTPVAQGDTCTAAGDHAGAEARRIRGIFKCY